VEEGLHLCLNHLSVHSRNEIEWMTFREALDTKVLPFIPKDGFCPFRTELEKALSIIYDLFHIISKNSNLIITSMRREVRCLQTDLKVMVFTLIRCENKGTDATGLKQLSLKVLDDPLSHGGCHPKCQREMGETNRRYYRECQRTWIECAVVET
jgi:hypothetical protein